MQISKLTITPLTSGCYTSIIDKPSPEVTGKLIKERLSSGSYYDHKTAKIFRKIPKFLKDLVNPQSKVSNERKFNTYY